MATAFKPKLLVSFPQHTRSVDKIVFTSRPRCLLACRSSSKWQGPYRGPDIPDEAAAVHHDAEDYASELLMIEEEQQQQQQKQEQSRQRRQKQDRRRADLLGKDDPAGLEMETGSSSQQQQQRDDEAAAGRRSLHGSGRSGSGSGAELPEGEIHGPAEDETEPLPSQKETVGSGSSTLQSQEAAAEEEEDGSSAQPAAPPPLPWEMGKDPFADAPVSFFIMFAVYCGSVHMLVI